MARRLSTAPTGAHSPSPITLPQLDQVQEAIDDESNAVRLLHRMAQDLRENLPDGDAFPAEARADVDALCSELGRLEHRLAGLSESLDVPGGAEVIPLRRHLSGVTP